MNTTVQVLNCKLLTAEKWDGFHAIPCGVYDAQNVKGQDIF
jgi:hypothetical protein